MKGTGCLSFRVQDQVQDLGYGMPCLFSIFMIGILSCMAYMHYGENFNILFELLNYQFTSQIFCGENCDNHGK